MKNFKKTSLATVVGGAVISSFAANVSADANPFAMAEMSGGYMQVAEANNLNNKVSEGGCGSNANKGASKKTEGSCGEGMCGGMMSGNKMKKGMEGMCGEMMKGKEGACGMMGGMNHGDDNKAKAAKSNEGSCGAMMGGDKAGHGSCGAMMKGGEGSCGSKVDSNKASGK